MIDNTSTPDTQEPASTVSPDTHSAPAPAPLLKISTMKKTRDPTWKTVPLGMVKGRDRTGGTKYSRMPGRPTRASIEGGLPVGKHYNLIFVRDGQRTARTYEITYTSPLDVSKTFRIRIAASSLRGLMRDVVYAIGNLRATETTENFSLHFTAITQKEGMTEEIVSVPYAEELEQSQKPSTDEPIDPIIVED